MAFDQAAFQKDLIYSRTAPVTSIRPDIGRLRQFDKAAEARVRAVSSMIGIGFFVFFFGTFVMMVFAVNVAEVLAPCIMIGAFSVMALFMVVTTVKQSRLKRFDLDDRRYEFLSGLLARLQVDLHPEEQVFVRMDLDQIDAKHKRFRADGSRGRWRITYGRDTWLTLRARFLDGTHFQLQVADQTETRRHVKRAKVKRKTTTTLTLQVRPKAKRYAHLETLGQDALRAVQLPGGVKFKLKPKADRLTLQAGVKMAHFNGRPYKDPDVDLVYCVTMMFLSLYQVLNLSRHLTKTGASTLQRRAPQPSPGVTLTPTQMFENLTLAAAVDLNLGEAERALLMSQSRRLGLDVSVVNDTFRRVRNGELRVFRFPSGAAARRRVFKSIVAVLRVDGVLDPREEGIIQKLAVKLGLPGDDVAEAVA